MHDVVKSERAAEAIYLGIARVASDDRDVEPFEGSA
jgi:hypothetical protein